MDAIPTKPDFLIDVPAKPDESDGLPSRDDQHSLGDLAERIVDNVTRELGNYGRTLRDEDLNSIQPVAAIIEAMAQGRAAHRLYLSTQPTGWGKTAALVAAVRAILDDPELTHVGIVILVSTLEQIPALVARMKLKKEDFAVRVGAGETDLNEMGLTGLCRTNGAKKVAHHYAPVLFTTQQKIAKGLMLYKKDFNDMSFFDYCGRADPDEIEVLKKGKCCGPKRQVRLWDEAYLPIDPITIGFDDVSGFASRLDCLGHPKAAKILNDWLQRIEDESLSYDTVPCWFIETTWPEKDGDDPLVVFAEDDEKARTLYEAMYYLQDQSVRILRQDYNNKTVAISYRRSIPHNIEPLLIFDAGGSQALEYRLIARSGGTITTLPSASKTYRNLTVRWYNHGSGQAAYRSRQEIEELASIAAQAALDKPQGEQVLIIHRKGAKAPATTLPALLRSKVRQAGGDDRCIHFLTWGNHKATNDFQNIKHVVLVGVHQAPLATIIALVYGTSRRPIHNRVSANDIELMRMSRIVADLNQAIGRSAVRKMTPEGDVPQGCTVDLIASSWGPMGFKDPEETLKSMFRGLTIKSWYPQISAAEPSREFVIVEAARSLLNGRPEAAISTGEWATEAGYSPRTLQRYLRTPAIADLLAARGIGLQKQGQKWVLKAMGDAVREMAA
jgi:hypothetical protein